jgi:hypothetical protein
MGEIDVARALARSKIGKHSKTKGQTFERTIVKLILEAVGEGFTKKDCYRVPASGGHHAIRGHDIAIGRELEELVPFGIECKHHKKFRFHHVFDMTDGVAAWHKQVVAAVDREAKQKIPLLVMREQLGGTYAALPEADWINYQIPLHGYTAPFPHVRYLYAGRVWIAILFSEVLKVLTFRSQQLRRERATDSTPIHCV